jgi:hypothetical protein
MIEGLSDAASSVLKLWMSFYSDRVGKREPILAIGYFVTAMMGTLGLVTAIWQRSFIKLLTQRLLDALEAETRIQSASPAVARWASRRSSESPRAARARGLV